MCCNFAKQIEGEEIDKKSGRFISCKWGALKLIASFVPGGAPAPQPAANGMPGYGQWGQSHHDGFGMFT